MLDSCVPDIVQARLTTCIAFPTYSCLLAQAAKEFLGHNPVPTCARPRRAKERGVLARRHGERPNALARVVCKCAGQFWSSRDPSHFEKLCMTYCDQPLGQVNIVQGERQGFIEAHCGSVQKQQQGAISQCPQWRSG